MGETAQVAQALAALTAPARLRPRNRFVLEMLCRSDGAISRWALVDALTPGSDDDGIVRYHVNQIRNALGDDAIATVRGVGYLATAKARAAFAKLAPA